MTSGTSPAHTVIMTSSSQPLPRWRWLAGTPSVVIVLTVLGAGVASVQASWTWSDALESFVVTNAVMGLAFGCCGAILAWHRPSNAIGWLFAVGGLLQALAAIGPPLSDLLEQLGSGTGSRRVLVTIFVYSWPWAIGLCVPLALLLFPNGRPVSPRWRPVIVAVVVTAPLFALQMGAAPVPVEDNGMVAYATLPFYDQLRPLWLVTEIRTLAVWFLALVALVIRYRRGTETVRRQLLWLLLALILAIAAMLPWGLVAGTPVAVLFSIPLIPLAVTLAIIRYRLLDIRLVVTRALTWFLLTLAVLAGYAVLVAALDQLISTQLGHSALATVLLVLLAAPALPRLQRLVDRALYGDRANPSQVVSRLGSQLAGTSSGGGSAAGLAGVAGSIRQALRLPYVGLEDRSEERAAAGRKSDQVVRMPLTYSGEVVGSLVIGLRVGERRLAEPDRRVLELLAAPLALAVHATVISAELQTSRERIIGTREEERRRLRRDLHDGLGPALTGIAFTADAAANSVADADRCRELLDSLRRDTRAALADVRRVVEDLRPPALDELGLVGALRQRADQLNRRVDGAPLHIRLDVPSEAPALPAGVEVAAYRIATEALTNIARHSSAESAVIRLRYGDQLEICVTDDGHGCQAWSPGIGLRSMWERTTELGGALTVGPSEDGGLVRASLPLGTR